MELDPSKAVLFIERDTVRYIQDGMNGVVRYFPPNEVKPISASFQGNNIIVNLEDGDILRFNGLGPTWGSYEYAYFNPCK